jgi:hypothetical protein
MNEALEEMNEARALGPAHCSNKAGSRCSPNSATRNFTKTSKAQFMPDIEEEDTCVSYEEEDTCV